MIASRPPAAAANGNPWRPATTLPTGADEILVGEFGGSTGRTDLLFFNRAASLVWTYEVDAAGNLQQLGATILGETSLGGTWDLATSGFLGQASGRHDLFVYNKTEGSAALFRVASTAPGSRTGATYPLATNPKLLAHELGHFFGLDHSQPEDFIAAPADRYGYDVDADDVRDTPPNPSSKGASPWNAVTNECDDSGANDVVISGTGFTYTLNPERHEIMAKGINCDGVYRMTPDQARAAHARLWERGWPIQ